MTKTIAVIGATGAQGGSVARTFVKIPGWKVRGITRNSQSSSARELAKLGIELVEANLDDVASLESAFEGADAIFGVTDFWQFYKDPKVHLLAKEENITWNEACYLRELQQGKNIVDAAVKVAARGGVQFDRLVLSSLADVKKASAGKYTWAYHFDSKAHYVQYLKERAETDPAYRALFEKTSYVQIGYYLDNWKMNPILLPQKQPDGSFVWRATTSDPPLDASKRHPIPFVHPPTDTGPFVEALVLKAPPQTTMLGTCSLMQFSDFVKLWGETLGVKVAVVDAGVNEIISKFPEGFGIEVAQSSLFVQEYGWDGGEGAILPEQCGVKRSDLADIVAYFKETDWSAVLD